jgi:hypothetical protein
MKIVLVALPIIPGPPMPKSDKPDWVRGKGARNPKPPPVNMDSGLAPSARPGMTAEDLQLSAVIAHLLRGVHFRARFFLARFTVS